MVRMMIGQHAGKDAPVDTARFDALTRAVSAVLSRRTLAGVLGLGALTLPSLADAKKKKRKRKKKKIKRNDFGCVNVGSFCKNGGQCCSGICQGKKGKKKCKAHDQSTCQAGQTTEECGGTQNVECTTSSGVTEATCFTTTGNAGYCGATGICVACSTDLDCVVVCGPEAACIPCTACEEDSGTACVGVSFDSCITV
jgi:hypothetical protein